MIVCKCYHKDLAFSFYLLKFADASNVLFMAKVEYDELFERLWMENKHRLLNGDREYQEVVDSYKMTSGADWLLFGIPVVVGVVSFEMLSFDREMFRWFVSAMITIATFVLSVFVKSLIVGGKSVSEIEDRIKSDCYQKYKETGKL